MGKKIKRVRVKGTNDDGWVENTGGVMHLDDDGECYLGEAFYMHAMMLEIEYCEDQEREPVWDGHDGTCQKYCPYADGNHTQAGRVAQHLGTDYIYCLKHRSTMAYAVHICPYYVTSLESLKE